MAINSGESDVGQIDVNFKGGDDNHAPVAKNLTRREFLKLSVGALGEVLTRPEWVKKVVRNEFPSGPYRVLSVSNSDVWRLCDNTAYGYEKMYELAKWELPSETTLPPQKEIKVTDDLLKIRELDGLPNQALAALRILSVKNNSRYDKWQGGIYTCNIYLNDIANILGVPVPHWLDRNGNVVHQGTTGAWETNPSDLNRWFKSKKAQEYGWKDVTSLTMSERVAKLDTNYMVGISNYHTITVVGLPTKEPNSRTLMPFVTQASMNEFLIAGMPSLYNADDSDYPSFNYFQFELKNRR